MIVLVKLSFGGGSSSISKKKNCARLAFDGAQCVKGAERTMKHFETYCSWNNGDEGFRATNARILL